MVGLIFYLLLTITRIHNLKFLILATLSDILRLSKRDQVEYNKYIVGFELNETDAKVSFYLSIF